MAAAVTISLEELIRLKAEARGFRLSPHQPQNSLLAGRYASRLRGRGLDFAELRGYRPGDDIRSIDWKATARRGRTQIRVYEEERERPVYIAVDQRKGMFFGSRRAMKSVAAAEAAALAAWRVLEGGDRVGGWVFGDEGFRFFRAKRGQSSVLQLLGAVAEETQRLTLKNDADSVGRLNEMLRDAEKQLTHDGLFILVSDLVGADEETGERLTRIAQHNNVFLGTVYDPLGIQISGLPGMWMDLGQETKPVPTDAGFPGRLRAEFAKEVAQWQQLFRKLKIPMLPISTDRPVIEQVREALGGQHG
ncbi:DUF58 domain-containing protein [Kiritimatiellaeota bacterium B1221]|nr:DUF58 domain-containing protein [Kiritimatiellaeota bacterium B1221]